LERLNGIKDQEDKEDLERSGENSLGQEGWDRRAWKDVVVDLCLRGPKGGEKN
jgi:hypothetical protein